MDVKRRAFSLIELLIVISIMGILIAIVTVSYTTVQKKSRDSRRASDLKAIQQAMEQYFTNNHSVYPDSCSGLTTTYLPNGMPADPQSGTPYSDASIGTCSSIKYCFCIPMEVNSGNTTINCADADTGLALYCIRNVQ